MDLLQFLPVVVGGYLTMRFITHLTKSKIRRKLPKIKTKRVDLFPEIGLKFDDRIIHLHHWLNFSFLLFRSIFFNGFFLDTVIVRGFLAGGVVEGFFLKDGYGRKIYYDKRFDQKIILFKQKLFSKSPV